jgi:hypothetical protein
MPGLAKFVVSTLVFLTVYFFSFWLLFVQIVPDEMAWLASTMSLLTAAAASYWAWSKTADAGGGVLTTALHWAMVVGAPGFTAGFFGQLIFTPEANQGPLLGIFISGPLGFILGGVAGLINALCRGSPASR